MNNQACKVRPEIINVNSDEPVFYPFSIKTSKCSGSCNKINDPHAKMWVPDSVKNLNVKVFDLMSRTSETRHIKWDEMCKCKYRLNANVCNNKQHWIMINVDVNVKNWLIKGYVIRGIFGILVIANVNVINHVMVVSILIIKSVEKS